MRSQSGTQLLLTTTQGHFAQIQTLGEGNWGRVELCKYEGDDPAILSICDHFMRVAVKTLKATGGIDKHEVKIISHLNQQGLNTKAKFNLSLPLKENDNYLAILSKFISYNHDPTHPQSASLLDFLRNQSETDDKNFNEDLALTMAQFTTAMKNAQDNLHAAGVLHLDTSLRNFLVKQPKLDNRGEIIKFKVVISDFGLSEISKGIQPVDISHWETGPIKSLDHTALENKKVSIFTDIFSLKVSAINMIGIMAGAKQEGSLLKLSRFDYSNQQFMEKRLKKFTNDEDVLKKYLKNAIKFLDEKYDEDDLNDTNYQQLTLYVDCYRDYLTHMPSKTNPQLAKIVDRKLIINANEKFLVRLINLNLPNINLDNNKAFHSFLLMKNKLMQLAVSEAFQQAPYYQALVNCISQASFSTFIKLHTDASQHDPVIKKLLGGNIVHEFNKPAVSSTALLNRSLTQPSSSTYTTLPQKSFTSTYASLNEKIANNSIQSNYPELANNKQKIRSSYADLSGKSFKITYPELNNINTKTEHDKQETKVHESNSLKRR
jgi:hypothetical protein